MDPPQQSGKERAPGELPSGQNGSGRAQDTQSLLSGAPPSADKDPAKSSTGTTAAQTARTRKKSSPIPQDPSRTSTTSIASTVAQRGSPASLSPTQPSFTQPPTGTERGGHEDQKRDLPDLIEKKHQVKPDGEPYIRYCPPAG